tara:strand:+ start:249 stop:530 length:282 start_codon:yes stop_codon:yes gene_type:complete
MPDVNMQGCYPRQVSGGSRGNLFAIGRRLGISGSSWARLARIDRLIEPGSVRAAAQIIDVVVLLLTGFRFFGRTFVFLVAFRHCISFVEWKGN